jgi:tetratricopeptide (TPR) repeat protein
MSQVEARRRTPWLVAEGLRVFASDGRSLLAGLPALLAGVVTLAVAIRVGTASEDQLISRYLVEYDRRAKARDFDGALACLDRLLQSRADWPELRFEQAKTHLQKAEHNQAKGESDQARGEQGQAVAILSQIAPVDRRGYIPAHLTLAKMLAKDGIRSESTYKQVEEHLKHAQSGTGPESADAAVLLGNLYAQTPGQAERAETYLLKAVDRQPALLLTLAELARQQKKDGVAKERAEHARAVFQKEAEEGFDRPEARLNWAQACFFLKDVTGAIAILERGTKLSGDPRYRRALATLYAHQENELAQKGAPVADRLALLEAGLMYDATNVNLLGRLSNLLLTGGPDESERARSALRDALTDGKVSAGVHCVLGMDASMRASLISPLVEAHPWSRSRGLDLGEHLLAVARARWEDEARTQWEQAFRLNPDMEIVANNLAWLLAHAPNPDLNRALDLADRAVKRNPTAPHYHGTRGVILMKLGRWSEALTDLEEELKHSPTNKQLHLSLAEVYDHQNDPEMARLHRARAEGKGKGAG